MNTSIIAAKKLPPGNAGPVLADGTQFKELFNAHEREVAVRVLNDREIHRLELERIFARVWLPVGHVSEIPNSGDWVARYLGEDSVLVVRARDGQINVLLNVCPHRAAEVCRSEMGNDAMFKCPYHGWAFDHSGNLKGVPFEREMYGDWDKSKYGLRRARVTDYHGLLFATFDETAPSFEEYLGDFKWYMDRMFGQVEMELAYPVVRTLYHANWKTLADQTAVDAYHVASVHQSAIRLGMIRGNGFWTSGLGGVDIGSREGHGLHLADSDMVSPMSTVPLEEAEKGPKSWLGHLTMAQGGLFPGTLITGSCLDLASNSGQEAMRNGSSAMFGATVPHGPGRFEQFLWVLVEKGNPALKEAALSMSTMNYALGPDDMTTWSSQQRAATGVVSQQSVLRYNTLLGVNKPAEWPGPCDVYAGASRDDNQWQFWSRWAEFMTNSVW